MKLVTYRNLLVEAHLVNGSIGHVRYIVYKPGEETTELPHLVVVEFEGYTGPTILEGHPQCVPIFRETAMWQVMVGDGNKRTVQDYSRNQFPLIPADGLSIHKAQGECVQTELVTISTICFCISGATMQKVIINLGPKEFSHGLTYTAVTRVRRLADLAFSPTPTFERFKSVFRTARFREQRNEERRKIDLSKSLLQPEIVEE